MSQYIAIHQEAESLYKVSGSKHIGRSFRIHSQEEAKKKIEALWEEHPQATHICWAYVLSVYEKIERSSDDGEPSGSAGKPILNQIKSFGVTECLVAVIRYYGGTKLGVPGLIDAYKSATKLALEASGKEEVEIEVIITLTASHENTPRLMNALNRLPYKKLSTEVAEQFSITVSVKEEFAEAIKALQH